MPVYEYECEQCGTHFERIQSVRDEPVRRCPECSGIVHKVFHPAGIIFKGSGWYITDSRKSSSASTAGESSKSTGTATDKAAEKVSEKASDGKEATPAAAEKKTEAKAKE